LIGDPSLTIDKSKYRKFDLAETWKSFTGFGFVFAMWMANAEKAEIAKTINFAAARDEGLNHLDEIVSNYEAEIPLAHEDFKKYLSENISYSINENMQKGLELFFRLAHKNQLIENRKALNFVEL
jgi:chorismate dehydratase